MTSGVALGLLAGKVASVFGFATLAVRLGLADAAANAGWLQILGVAMPCGIFITLLAFPENLSLQSEAKIGVLAGSLLSGALGYAVFRVAKRDKLTGVGITSPVNQHLA
ncbi:Na+/H+ antiporter NhaA [Sphingomonas sp. S2-65]|uniref:Na+/H+ antiporter NhaA n=1 Tax=Sphingomonas sp. S2-65 TaxID=2903960 RepID=UPI0021BC6455|nr:Na+/H+ antiporter NhaA [Sphingomonas sp. S2-65]UYY57120.1 Na+/H+ antiporter NhaA [Sphingomonas sp. S2-65]